DLRSLLRPEAMTEVIAESGHRTTGRRARSAEELAVYLSQMGDLAGEEITAICASEPAAGAWLRELATAGRVTVVEIPNARGTVERWTPVDLAPEYRAAFAGPAGPGRDAACSRILRRYLRWAGPVTASAIRDRYGFSADWLAAELTRLVETLVIAQGRFTPAAGEANDEYCDMPILEQMHRRTLSQLRRSVQAVTLAAYSAFLTRWQHLAPGSRLDGKSGLASVMHQLRGLALPAPAWEEAILPPRLAGYRSVALAELSGSGGLVWTASGADAQHARLRFFFRGEGGLFLPPAAEDNLSEAAQSVRAYLADEGASFLADLQAGLRLPPATLAAALVELALAGLVTNDSLAALAAVLAQEQTRGDRPVLPGGASRQPLSALERDLAARMAGKPRPLTATRYRAAKRQARRLVTEVTLPPAASPTAHSATDDNAAASATSGLGAGRWSLVHRTGVLGPAQNVEERVAAQTRVLLERYGIVTRDCLAREDGPYEWPQIYAYLQRLEMRGEVRRGYFVAGLSGAQFALPAAVEALRAPAATDGVPPAGTPAGDAGDLLVINAVDPANIYGGEMAIPPATPAEETEELEAPARAGDDSASSDLRFARLPSTDLILWRGRPLLVAEDHGGRLAVRHGVHPDLIRQAVTAYLACPWTSRHLTVTTWDGAPVWGSLGESILKAAGFYRSPGGMEWWNQD
ncbi:MAG TPA: hypothetical protein VGA61_09350, partial [Anaerolineae bacterium]